MAFGLKARTFALLLYLIATVKVEGASHSSDESISRVLRSRQTTCPANQPVSCAAVDPKLPKNFCCPANTACISLDASSSALCCPNNGPCTAIELINCDVKLQDPTVSGPIVTSRLNDRLPTCGNACCPFGYTCGRRSDGSNFCQLDLFRAIVSPVASPSRLPTPTLSIPPVSNAPTATNSNPLPSGTAPTNSNPSISTDASAGTISPTMQASGLDSTKPQNITTSANSNPFPPGVFLAGFFPGMLIGALAVLGWVILTGRHRKPGAPTAGSEYGKRPEITDPYGEPNARSDIISRTKTIGKSVFAKKNAVGTPGLPFDSAEGWKTLTPPENNIIPVIGNRIPAGPGARLSQGADGRGPRQTETSYYNQIVNDVGYPTTPTRNQSVSRESNPTGEILLAYTPQRPPSAVAPLRGMTSQRRSRDSGVGVGTGYNMRTSPPNMARAPYAAEDDESVYDSNEQEIASPTRYEGGGGFQRRPTIMGGGVKKKPDRPETTFTEMLRQINFPDPINDRSAPAMPAIPKEFRT